MTFGPSRLSLNEVQPAAPRRLPRPVAPVPASPAALPRPDPLALGRALGDLTLRPVNAQRRAVQAPLRAAALARQEEGQVRQRRQELEATLGDLGNLGADPAASPAPARAERRSPGAPPRTPGEWVTALRDRAETIEGQPLDSRQVAQFTALQRQVAHTLAQGFRQDRRAPQDRYGDYGDHLATLQRHPVSAPVAGVVLGLVPAAERPALQRAAAEGLERQLAQEETLTRAENRQTVQRQLADLDAEACRPLLERIQARRGAGNPLPEGVRRHLEGGLNHDLARVRIHDDAEAHKLAKGVRAIAFTAGTDIFFRRGHFDPNSRSGLELLAHEVTHTVQQSRGRVGGGMDPDAGLEAEARVMGARLAQAMPGTVMPSAKSLLPPVSPHAPGVYTPAAATARVQAGAAQRFALKPLHDLQPRSVQRFDLGGALGAAWDATGGKVIEKGKELVASGLKVIPGYKELCLAFGRDLVTGQAVGGSAEGILTALTNWVPGPLKDILRALRETNVIGKAWDWFKGELGKLDLAGALGEIASAIGKADLGAAKSAVTRRISGVKNLIVGSARKIAEIGLTALTAGLGPLGQQIMAKLKGAGDVIVQVLKDPVKFARNLISAVGGGFKAFGSNAPKHLQNGIGQWLTSASGITFPASFSLEGVFMTALSVMGLTYQALRGKLVRALGPGGADKVGKAESTVQALQTMKGGLQHASEMKGEQGGVGKAVQDGVKSEVTKSLVLTGIQKLVTMLVPGGGFINAVIGAFQTVQTIVQQAAQIGQVVTSALGSVAAIAAGNISGAVGLIDRALGGAIPVALAWLGKLVGLGNLGGKIRNVINKVRGRLDRVVDKIVAKVKGIIEKVLGKGKPGEKPKAGPTSEAEKTKDHDERVKKGLADLPRIEQSFARGGQLENKEAAQKVARALKGRHTIFRSVTPKFSKENISYDWVASSGTQPGTVPLILLNINVEAIRKEFWSKAGRPSWTSATKSRMAKDYPQHHVTLPLVGVTTVLKSGYDRRHIMAFDQTVTSFASQLKNMPLDEAKTLLSGRGYAPKTSSEAAIKAALKKFLAAEFNKVENLFVDEAAENQEKGRQMEAAEQRRKAALTAGDRQGTDRETQRLAREATDVPRGAQNGQVLSAAERALVGQLRDFDARDYAGLRGKVRAAKAGRSDAATTALLRTAETALDATRRDIAELANFSKSGSNNANRSISSAIAQATAQMRELSDILGE